jgi:hypothetical protein
VEFLFGDLGAVGGTLDELLLGQIDVGSDLDSITGHLESSAFQLIGFLAVAKHSTPNITYGDGMAVLESSYNLNPPELFAHFAMSRREEENDGEE